MFYLTLPSNASPITFPENTPGKFKVIFTFTGFCQLVHLRIGSCLPQSTTSKTTFVRLHRSCTDTDHG